MKTLVIGDIHGCVWELESLLEQAQADRVILVGDLFTKGPDPVGVWNLIKENNFESVMGNHDDWLVKIGDGWVEGTQSQKKCIEQLNKTDPDWFGWVKALPLFLQLEQFTIVHAGLHPSGSLDLTTPEMALSMRRWPREEPDCPYWQDVYMGSQGVIFGHDAKRGLVQVRRNDQPYLIGLDTGCVYGHFLTGYLIETDQLIQVKARDAYCPIGTEP